jgi:LPXTG-site transpeptidase (sortase) family protein
MEGRARTGSSVGRGFALAVPFILFFAGVFFLSMYLYQSVVEETAYFSLIVGENVPQEIEIETAEDTFIPAERPNVLTRVPSIRYGSQFARLNVDGWSIRNIPVYLGADKKILKKGAGMSFGSVFPGEDGCTILSAHVTRHFRELENTQVGTILRIETSYGPYVYRVTDKRIAKGTDRWFMDAGQDADLMLYTCYPYDNHGKRRTDRCVLICEMIEGTEVAK